MAGTAESDRGGNLSAKRFCIVPPPWSLEDVARHSCDDHSHFHLSRAQVYAFQQVNSIMWIAIRYRGDDAWTETDKPDLARKWAAGVLKISKIFAFRGRSASFGEYLAGAVREREDWAITMLSQMHGDR